MIPAHPQAPKFLSLLNAIKDQLILIFPFISNFSHVILTSTQLTADFLFKLGPGLKKTDNKNRNPLPCKTTYSPRAVCLKRKIKNLISYVTSGTGQERRIKFNCLSILKCLTLMRQQISHKANLFYMQFQHQFSKRKNQREK